MFVVTRVEKGIRYTPRGGSRTLRLSRLESLPALPEGLRSYDTPRWGNALRCGRAAPHRYLTRSVAYRRAKAQAARCGDCFITDRRQQEAVP